MKSLPEAIVVGGINKKNILGLAEAPVEPFSNPGSNILISAPANYLPSVARGISDKYGNYFKNSHELLKGTSFAAPIVSGIVGAMLKVNKNLDIYDIQLILAYSAKIIDSTNNEWSYNRADTFNGGGLHYSYDYGFGCIDAGNAIKLAKNWISILKKNSKTDFPFSQGRSVVDKQYKINSKLPQVSKSTKIISASVKFIAEEIDILGLNVSLLKDGEEYPVLKSKSATNSKMISLAWTPFSPTVFSVLGENLESNIGVRLYNSRDHKIKFAHLSLTLQLQADLNTQYIFTDEYSSLYDEKRASIEGQNVYNTLNLAAVTQKIIVNLADKILQIGKKICTLNGSFDAIISGDDVSEIELNNKDNVVINNSIKSSIRLGDGHNTVATSELQNSSVDITSGNSADMFVVRKAPNSTTTIHNFKTNQFDSAANGNVYSDIINLACFKEITSAKKLNIDRIGGDRVIKLPDNQNVVIKNTGSLYGYNFRFTDEFYNIANCFSGKCFSDDTITDVLFSRNNHVADTNIPDVNYILKENMENVNILGESS